VKRRVALISSCAPPLPGRPVTGGGLRTVQLLETLRSAGHSVRLFVEAEALPKKAPEALLEHSFTATSLQEQVRAFRPSLVVVEQWALVALLGDLDKALVIDLHGSLLLENVYRRGDTDLTLDAGAKIKALARADLLLVPAPVQAHHFSSWATLAGFDPRELPIAQMPLAMDRAPAPRRAKKPALKLVYGGARWPWIDSLDALVCAAEAVAKIETASLDVFTYEPPRHGLAFEEDLGTWPEVSAALSGREEDGIYLHDGVEHARWQSFLRDEATVALDLWQPNPERMLAATTRSVEFLWAGLPVITVRGAAWAEALLASGAGWALPAGDPAALTSLVERLAAKPAEIRAASTAATELIRTQHSLERAGQALLQFCIAPKRPPRSEATLIESLLAVREAHLEETLRSLQRAHESEHERLIAGQRGEQAEDRGLHKAEIDALSEAHRLQVDKLVEGQQGEQAEDRGLHKAEIDALSEAHRQQVDELVANQRTELQDERKRHREETRRMTSEHGAEVKELVRAAAAELHEQGKTNSTALLARDERAREELEQVVAARHAEIEELSQTHRQQIERLAEERQDEVQKLVGRGRAELEQADERHRAEMHARLAELQEQLASDRRHVKEERSRLEVELRAEMAARELDLQQQMVNREAELNQLLELANRTLSQKLKDRLATAEGWGPLPGRLAPAARLARLWAEHAVDRTQESEE